MNGNEQLPIHFIGQLTYAIEGEDTLYLTGFWEDHPLSVLLSALGGEWVNDAKTGHGPGWRFPIPKLAPAIHGARIADVTADIDRYRKNLIEAQRQAALLLEEG